MHDGLSAESRHFGSVVADTLRRHGGTEIARRCQADPTARADIDKVLAALGLWEIDPLDDLTQLEAAAAACHAAGGVTLPYPVAERLAATSMTGADAVVHVDDHTPRIAHGGLDLTWLAMEVGRQAPVVAEGPLIGSRTGRFAADVEVGAWQPAENSYRLAVLLTLQAWTLLGAAEEVARQTYGYVSERRQFGSPLSEFQAVRFSLTDVEVQLEGLTETARYTLWALRSRQGDGWTDALALRLTALEAADVIFRICHQAYGAMGLCDETDLSWFSQYSQALRRLPWGRSSTERALLHAMRNAPLSSPFATS
jgi:acyl-CoA dehydrogenase-like protein